MAYSFSSLERGTADVVEWLRRELSSIQTGKATPAALDSIMVSSYGTKVKVQELASITAEDARSLRIVPWDKNAIRDIEAAIRDADLGVGVSADEEGVRVSFPELTTETREKFVKMARKKLEEARVSLRNERDEVWNDIQKKEKDGEIGKDEKFRFKEEMEELTKKANGELEKLAERKEREVLGK